MIAAGVNVKAISQSLGHANIGITLDTYGHLLPGIARTAAERFDDAFTTRYNETANEAAG
jgi:integrase